MYTNDVTEGVQDEEGSEDDDSVKTDRGDNVMSLYNRDEKVSEDTGDQESAAVTGPFEEMEIQSLMEEWRWIHI
ncbi:hypothetical protein LWI28_018165 [Acer negundo]|uniref:Uncharacterized protein n=1 Tax=Acer negundo TaxID=4023 RepID=A0AAD5JIA7_ACENE|nr:hypothetical protein LWI28_018165 [Acer negundo]